MIQKLMLMHMHGFLVHTTCYDPDFVIVRVLDLWGNQAKSHLPCVFSGSARNVLVDNLL